MEVDGGEGTGCFVASGDICQQILTRYSRSSAEQHRHLCATTAAARSMIKESSLDLNPVSYFAAAVTSLDNASNLDGNALDSLTSFLSIVIPLVSAGEIKREKAEEAVGILVRTVDEFGVRMGTSGVRAAVKSVGVLVAKFCSLDEWDSVSLGFEWLAKFSMDKRPKVRKCAQDSLMTIFKSFQSSTLFKRSSKSIYMLLSDQMMAVSKLRSSKIVDGSGTMLPEHQNIIHLLGMMKNAVPYLSLKSLMRMVLRLLKMVNHQIVAVTTHVFDTLSAVLEISTAEVILPNAGEFFSSLVSYMSPVEKNSIETVLLAATLSKTALRKLHGADINEWTIYLPTVTEPLSGYLYSDAEVAVKASNILVELIEYHIDEKRLSRVESQQKELICDAEYKAIKSICDTFYNLLNVSPDIPNEYVFTIASCLFRKLGKMSGIFMEHILLKFGELMNATTDSSKTTHLQKCFGFAVSAMGPQRLLALLPLSFSIKDVSYSNIWLMPILEKNVFGSSLRFFLEHFAPLAKSFEKASRKVKNSAIRQDLQAYSRGCWALFPAFCRQPIDTYQSFGELARLLIPLIQRDFFIMEKVATGLQVLIHENRLALRNQGSVESVAVEGPQSLSELSIKLAADSLYSTKTAKKNIKALASSCKEFLQAFINAFFESAPEHQKFLKGAIGSLVSICDASEAKEFFIASAEKFHLLEDIGEDVGVKSAVETSVNDEESAPNSLGKDDKRCLQLDFASCFVEGSDEDLVYQLFCLVKHALQVSDEFARGEAYRILSRILETHSWFCISKFDEVVDLLTKIKSTSNLALLQYHFSCLQTLLIASIKENIEDESPKAFVILNELIITLKDSGEEGRKLAYDTLHGISCKLRNSSESSDADLYPKFIAMISGYLSVSSPHIKSGVVSAISVLVYGDHDLCITMPHVFHSVMELLHSKSIEIIKAVLGFVKVLVSCLGSEGIQRFLSDILDGILRWSSVSRHYVRSKVTVILEIMIRKCGTATVKAATPEKYKDLVAEVAANRRGNKPSSKEAGNNNAKSEQPDSSLKGQRKRKRAEAPGKSESDQSRKNAQVKKQKPENRSKRGRKNERTDKTNKAYVPLKNQKLTNKYNKPKFKAKP